MTQIHVRAVGHVHSSPAELRAFADRGACSVKDLATSREMAARRLAARSAVWTQSSKDLVDELLARDEELAAATEELREQVEALTSAAVLLERERSKYVDLFALAPDAYVVTDIGGVTQEANRAAGELFGVEPRFLAGRRLITFVARQDTRTFRSFLEETLKQEQGARAARSFTLRMRPRGQPVFVACGRATLVRTATHEPLAVRWMLRRLDQNARDSGEKLAGDALARTLVDDLRGPLATICAWSRLLQGGQVDDPREQALALEWIRKSAETQQATLENLAELCETGEAPEAEDAGSVDFAAVASTAIAAMSGARKEEGAPRVTLEATRQHRLARGDATRLDRAIAILLHRCVDGTPRGAPPIRARLSSADGQVVLDIQAPEGAAVPAGWGVRVAVASRLLERDGGGLMVTCERPSCRLWLPEASPTPDP